MKLRFFLLFIVLLIVTNSAQAIVPETGLYWMPQFSGTAVYVEHQKGTVSVVIYAFDKDTGQAEIYLFAGPLLDDGGYIGLMQPDPPLSDTEGLFPSHWYQGDLYKVSRGQPLIEWQPGYSAQSDKVGSVTLGFLYAGSLNYVIKLDDGPVYDESQLFRFDFSQGRFVSHNGAHILFDVLGEWVFVDVSDPAAAALRFDFSERDPVSPPGIIEAGQSLSVTYRDPTRNARLVCAQLPEGDSGDPEQAQKRSGCELYVGDELILSANLIDIGIDRIQAYRGALGPQARNPFRRSQTIIGMRVRHADSEPVGNLRNPGGWP